MIIHNTPMMIHSTPKMKRAARVEMSEKFSGSCEFKGGGYIRNFLVTQGKIVALSELITFLKIFDGCQVTWKPVEADLGCTLTNGAESHAI
jgi:hypothetical protein